jgi:hypothetical protein
MPNMRMKYVKAHSPMVVQAMPKSCRNKAATQIKCKPMNGSVLNQLLMLEEGVGCGS